MPSGYKLALADPSPFGAKGGAGGRIFRCNPTRGVGVALTAKPHRLGLFSRVVRVVYPLAGKVLAGMNVHVR